MTVIEDIKSDQTQVMKQKAAAMREGADDEMLARIDLTLSTLRAVNNEFTSAMTSGKERKDTLTDAEAIALMKKLAKRRRETAAEFRAIGREDRATVEDGEASIIEQYLPVELSEDETRAIVETIVAEKNLAGTGGRGIGQVMGALKNRDDIDKGVASKIAKELIG